MYDIKTLRCEIYQLGRMAAAILSLEISDFFHYHRLLFRLRLINLFRKTFFTSLNSICIDVRSKARYSPPKDIFVVLAAY